MSREVDQRVVEMRFDNRDFEKGVSETMSTLDKFKQKLNFSDAVSSFDDVTAAARSTDMTPLSNAVEIVHEKFSKLEVVAMTALSNIANSALNAGKQLVASLSTDQIMAGFTKYEDETKAVQTIMNATGMSIEDVEKELEKLSWFTDETSYNYVDMVSNIGKFTSMGMELDKSVTAMEGIANWAALSGQGATEASRAMYNLAQAIGMGSVQIRDWQSIENANMGTLEFKETAIETAKALGLLDKAGKDVKGNLVTAKTFRETLTDGWLTSDVLMKTLEQYGAYSDKVYQYMQSVDDEGLSCAEAMKLVSDETMTLGAKAFKAAQEAKTFTEALDATKDAVSTGWKNTFKILFGNYEQAKVLWTDLAMDLFDIFGAGADKRNQMLAKWQEDGGRDNLIKGFKNVVESIKQTLDVIKKAFHDIFPEKTAKDLIEFTEKFEKFTEKLKMNDDAVERVRSTLKGFFAIFSIGKQIVSGIFQVIKPLFDSLFSKSSGNILNTTADIGEFLTALSKSGKITEFFTEKLKKLSEVFGIVGGVIDDLFTQAIVSFYEGGGGLGGVIEIIFDSINTLIRGFFDVVQKITGINLSGIVDGVTGFIRTIRNHVVDFVSNFGESWLAGKLSAFFDGVKEFFARFKTVDTSGLDSLGDKVHSLWERMKKILEPIKEFLDSAWEHLKTWFQKIKDALSEFFGSVDLGDVANVVDTGLLAGIVVGIKKLIGSLKEVVDSGASIKDSICGVLDGLKGSLEAMQKDVQSKTILRIAASVALLAVALVELSKIDEDKLSTSLIAISTLFGELMGSMALFGKMSNSDKFDFNDLKKIATSMILMAVAVALLASSMKKLSELSMGEIAKGVLAIGALLGELVAAVALFQKISPDTDLKTIAASLVIMAVSIKMLASSMEQLGALSMAEIGKGLLAIGGLFGELIATVALFNAISPETDLKSIATSLILMAVSISILASSIGKLGEMSMAEIGKGLLAIGGLLAELVLAIAALNAISPSGMIAAGAGILIIAAAMAVMIPVLKTFGDMSLAEIGKGLLAVGGSLAIFAAAAALMKSALPGAAAILVIAAALAVLTPVLKVLGNMSVGEIVKSLALIAGTLGIMVGAAYLAAPVAPILLALGAAVALLGVGCMGVGAGLLMFTLALDSLAVAAPVMVMLIVKAVQGLIDLIPYLIEKIGEGIIDLIKLIGDSAEEIAKSIIKVVESTVKMLRTVIPMVVNLLLDLLVEILEGIDRNIGKIVELLLSIVTNIINGIANKIGGLIDAFMNFIEKFLNGVADAIENHGENIFLAVRRIFKNILKLGWKVITTIWDDIKKLGNRVVEGLKEGIHDKIETVKTKIKELADAVISKIKEVLGIKSPSTVFKEIGGWLIDGFINGIKEKIEAVKNAIAEVAGNAVDKLKSFLGIASPSKEFAKIGRYSMEGMALGVEKYSSAVTSSFSEVGESSIYALQSTFAKIADFLDGNIDCQPTIRPVLDLSGVSSKAGQIDALFSRSQAMTISASMTHQAEIQNGTSSSESVPAYATKEDVAGLRQEMKAMNHRLNAGIRVNIANDREFAREVNKCTV